MSKQYFKLDQRGIIDTWLIAFILTLVVFFAATGFGVWAYSGKQDYKNNVDAKIAKAVEIAETANSEKKDKEFLEKEKEPLRTYTGPASFGSVSITYPKTWSAYFDESGKGNAPIDGSLNPNFVPGLNSGVGVALRVQVLNIQYTQAIRSFETLAKNGKSKITPFQAEKVPSITGIRIEGEITGSKQGTMIILPLRDKTLQLWSEGSQYTGDFNSIILKNLNFIP